MPSLSAALPVPLRRARFHRRMLLMAGATSFALLGSPAGASNPDCQASSGAGRNLAGQVIRDSFAATDWNSSLKVQASAPAQPQPRKAARTVSTPPRTGVSALVAAAPAGVVSAALSPSTIDEDFFGTVDLVVTGLPTGAPVRVDKFQVNNTTGTIDGSALLVQSFLLTDGQPSQIGGLSNPNVPADSNGVDGSIVAQLSFLSDDAPNTIGEYVFRFSSLSNAFAPVTARFTVDDAPDAQKFTGTVQTNGNPVANPIVVLLDSSGGGYEFVAAAVADGAGHYALGADPAEYDLVAIKRGFVGGFGAGVGRTLAAGVDQVADLTLEPGTRTISGRLQDRSISSLGLPGVQVIFRSQDGKFTVDYTDAYGNFSTAVTPGEWDVEVQRNAVNQLGYLAPGRPRQVDTTAGNVSNLAIALPQATVLVHGQVRDANGAVLAHVDLDAGSLDGEFQAFTATDFVGRYVIAIGGGDWQISPTAGGLEELGYVGPAPGERLFQDGQAVLIDFSVPVINAHLSGTLRDETNTPLEEVSLVATQDNGTGRLASFQTEPNGTFNVGITDGSWRLVPEIQDAAESDLIFIAQAAFAVSAGQTIANIDLRAQHPTRHIVVRVLDDHGDPYEGAQLSARIVTGNLTYFSFAFSDQDGNASLPAFDGTWTLSADGAELGVDGFRNPSPQPVVLNGSDPSLQLALVPRDLFPPEILSGPASPQFITTGAALPDYTAQLQTLDDQTVTVAQDPPAGTIPAQNSTVVTLTATDSDGNATSYQFDVLVRPLAPATAVLIAPGRVAPGAGNETGPPADAKLSTFGTPAIDDAGNIAFLGRWESVRAGRGNGLFTALTCLARLGADVPGHFPANYKTLGEPVLGGGQVACLATFSGVVRSATGAVLAGPVAGPLAVVAQTGFEAAPGTGGAVWKSFKDVEVHGDSVLIFAQLTAGTGNPRVTAASDYGLWIKSGANPFVLVLREGVPLPNNGPTIRTLAPFKTGNGSPGQGRGWLRTVNGVAQALTLATMADGRQAVFSAGASGAVQTLLVAGVEGFAGSPDYDFTTFTNLGVPAANDREQSAMVARANFDDRQGHVFNGFQTLAVDFAGRGTYNELVATGSDTPNLAGSFFSIIKDPVLAADGGIAFPATIAGGTARGFSTTSLWWKPPGANAPRLLAQGGLSTIPVSGVPGAQWRAFTSLAIASHHGPIFAATLLPGHGQVTPAKATGVWATDFSGTLKLLFRTGDSIAVGLGQKTLKSFTVLNATLGSTGVTRSFNDTPQIIWRATFHDNTQAIVVTEVP